MKTDEYKYKYICIHNHHLFPGKTRIGEHRLVMAEYLNRPLLTEEDVHHKDEDRSNNQIDNLEIKIHGKHIGYHKLGNKNLLGHKHSIETKKRMSLAQKGNQHWLGREHTTETRQKMSLNNKRVMLGKHFTAEAKHRMSLAHRFPGI